MNQTIRSPSLADIKFNNLYWQVLKTQVETYYLYEAYLDVRKLNYLGPTVRIIGMANEWKKEVLYCHFWFSSEVSVKSEPAIIESISKGKYVKSNLLWSIMISCKIPENFKDKIPVSVSLTGNSHEKYSNNLRLYMFYGSYG